MINKYLLSLLPEKKNSIFSAQRATTFAREQGYNQCLQEITEVLGRVTIDEEKVVECCQGWYGGDWEQIAKIISKADILKTEKCTEAKWCSCPKCTIKIMTKRI